MRIPLIAGNWKMNLSCRQGTDLVTSINAAVKETEVEVAVCCPSILLGCIGNAVKNTGIKLGAQNMHWEEAGAFTGEISADMLLEAKVDYVIIGHSERRHIFGETDEMVNKKVVKALSKKITPIMCIGETLDEREAEETFSVLNRQLEEGIKGVSPEEAKTMVIAYEPVWAIGTGKTATPEQANEAIGYIRNELEKLYGSQVSEELRILYGGSVKPNNATEIMNCEEIDGALVGGASLKADDFIGIIQF